MSEAFDFTLLRTFLAVVETHHFTGAAHALGLSQSTISQHIRRLETAAGRQLLARDTHVVALTPDGHLMAGFARDIVEASRRATDYFGEIAPRGRVRFGVSEDLALTRLPAILRHFRAANPLFDVELTVGLTGGLYQSLDAGRLDLIFAKRRASDDRGHPIWREKLTWMAAREFRLMAGGPVPLVLHRAPSVTSGLTIEALNRAGVPWFVASSSETLTGLRAAALAGLGVAAQSTLLLQGGDLVAIDGSSRLPALDQVEFVVLGRSSRLQGATAALRDVIVDQGPDLWSAPPPSTPG